MLSIIIIIYDLYQLELGLTVARGRGRVIERAVETEIPAHH